MSTNRNPFTPVFAIVNQIKAFDKEFNYKEELKQFTNGRTDSLRELESKELQAFISELSKKVGKTWGQNHTDGRDKQRKSIIAIFKKNNKTTADAIAWAEKQGVRGVKKGFNDYNTGELVYLINVAETLWLRKR